MEYSIKEYLDQNKSKYEYIVDYDSSEYFQIVSLSTEKIIRTGIILSVKLRDRTFRSSFVQRLSRSLRGKFTGSNVIFRENYSTRKPEGGSFASKGGVVVIKNNDSEYVIITKETSTASTSITNLDAKYFNVENRFFSVSSYLRTLNSNIDNNNVLPQSVKKYLKFLVSYSDPNQTGSPLFNPTDDDKIDLNQSMMNNIIKYFGEVISPLLFLKYTSQSKPQVNFYDTKGQKLEDVVTQHEKFKNVFSNLSKCEIKVVGGNVPLTDFQIKVDNSVFSFSVKSGGGASNVVKTSYKSGGKTITMSDTLKFNVNRTKKEKLYGKMQMNIVEQLQDKPSSLSGLKAFSQALSISGDQSKVNKLKESFFLDIKELTPNDKKYLLDYIEKKGVTGISNDNDALHTYFGIDPKRSWPYPSQSINRLSDNEKAYNSMIKTLINFRAKHPASQVIVNNARTGPGREKLKVTSLAYLCERAIDKQSKKGSEEEFSNYKNIFVQSILKKGGVIYTFINIDRKNYLPKISVTSRYTYKDWYSMRTKSTLTNTSKYGIGIQP